MVTVALGTPEKDPPFRPVRADGLPIYRLDRATYALFYAPGYLCVVNPSAADRFEARLGLSEAEAGPAGRLWRQGEAAAATRKAWQEQPFSPECLTLYLNNECSLRCVYCYSDPSPVPAPRLSIDAVRLAATLVAENCRKKGRPLYVVFHGGGEPALDRDHAERILAEVEAVARSHEVALFRYVATNGVMSEAKAAWLARRFDLVGLSCDGPEDIQRGQRPLRNGGGTSRLVERTARILQAEGCPFHVRATITRASLPRQAEIAEYFCRHLSPREIHFEPVYRGGRADGSTALQTGEAGEFVAHFLRAREVARGNGVGLSYAGSRPSSVHGPYCNVFREVLNLVPGGVATACFKTSRADAARARGMVIGWADLQARRFVLDESRVQALRHQLDGPLPGCADCFNYFHCAGECPSSCPMDGSSLHGDPAGGGFRCQVQKALTYAVLQEEAKRVWETSHGDGEGVYGVSIL